MKEEWTTDLQLFNIQERISKHIQRLHADERRDNMCSHIYPIWVFSYKVVSRNVILMSFMFNKFSKYLLQAYKKVNNPSIVRRTCGICNLPIRNL